LLDTVDDGHQIAPGITILGTPGETPGHLVVRVSSGGEHFYYLGDLIHHACEANNIGWVSHGDAEQARVSRRRVFDEMAQAGGVSVTTHDLFSPGRRLPDDAGLSRRPRRLIGRTGPPSQEMPGPPRARWIARSQLNGSTCV